MKRRVFSAPDLGTAEQALGAALRLGIRPGHAAVLAQSDVEMNQLPDAEKESSPTDFMPAARRGIVGGAIIGLVAGLIGMFVPSIGFHFAGAVITTVVGAIVGGWAAALAGSSVPSEPRRDFQKEIDAGQLLVVIDEEDEALLDRASQAIAATGGMRPLKQVPHGLLG
jgi:predicted lipid-binding transport protein (Tim44 family)